MNTNNTPKRIAFIQACWHRDIVDQLRNSFAKEFASLSSLEVDFIELPGAYEIPLHAKRLAETGHYAGIVAAGLVVDGGIYRHDFVASTVIDNLMRAQMDTGVPVFSAVLTPHHFHAGEEHISFYKEHFVKKGKEAAQACAQTIESLAKITT
jgi:6,7-dimethyl-8-ribityllumazine synthase